MTYRALGERPYDGVVCGLCNNPPQPPQGIQGWVFDQNLIACLKCRKQGHDTPKDLEPDITLNILDRILMVLKRGKQ